MQKVKSCLERYPLLYRIARGVFLFFYHIFLKLVGFREYLNRNKMGVMWASRHLHEGEDWIKESWDSRDHPHRPFLIEQIAGFAPVAGILEIGCGAGPNLYLLAGKFPGAAIEGIEINPLAVQKGNEWLKQAGIPNAALSAGSTGTLGAFDDKSFDVVFTDAVLIYVNKAGIRAVIREMLRIARKGLVLVERHDIERRLNDATGTGVFTGNLWVRDYAALLKQFVPEEQIRVTRITREIWPTSVEWQREGAIIAVTLENPA